MYSFILLLVSLCYSPLLWFHITSLPAFVFSRLCDYLLRPDVLHLHHLVILTSLLFKSGLFSCRLLDRLPTSSSLPPCVLSFPVFLMPCVYIFVCVSCVWILDLFLDGGSCTFACTLWTSPLELVCLHYNKTP